MNSNNVIVLSKIIQVNVEHYDHANLKEKKNISTSVHVLILSITTF